MKAQRLRFQYRVTAPDGSLGHRDIVAAFEAAAGAGGLALSYSEGKRRSPQISLASALPFGVTSECELADVYLAERVEPCGALAAMRPHFPPGMGIVGATEIGLTASSLQSELRWAEYEVDIPAGDIAREDVEAAIERLLSAATVPAEYRREKKSRAYDLRPLVLDVRLAASGDGVHRLRMRLRTEQDNSGRADQVVLAMGLPEPLRVHRTRLYLADVPAAVLAYRREGEPGSA